MWTREKLWMLASPGASGAATAIGKAESSSQAGVVAVAVVPVAEITN